MRIPFLYQLGALLAGLRRSLRGRQALLALLLLSFVGPWVVFINVAEDIWESGGFVGDQRLLRWAHAHSSPLLDRLAVGLTTVGGPAPMLAVAAALLALLWWRGPRRAAGFFLLGVGGAMLLNVLVKLAFGRPRPALWVSILPATFYSFPSGHAMGSAAVAAALGFLLARSRWRWALWLGGGLFTLAVGWSRVYLGVHYPSDVLAGWVGSLGWVGGLHLLFSPYFRQLRAWGRHWLRRRPAAAATPETGA